MPDELEAPADGIEMPEEDGPDDEIELVEDEQEAEEEEVAVEPEEEPTEKDDPEAPPPAEMGYQVATAVAYPVYPVAVAWTITTQPGVPAPNPYYNPYAASYPPRPM